MRLNQLYGYANQNTLSWIDPSGLWTAVVVDQSGLAGAHAAIFIVSEGLPNFLYDPAGNFLRYEKGPDGELLRAVGQDVLEGRLADLNAFVQFQGPNTSVYWFNTSRAEEAAIRSSADADDRRLCGPG